MEWAAVDDDFHSGVIQAELVQDGRLKRADVLALFDSLIADFIGASVNCPPANTAARQP